MLCGKSHMQLSVAVLILMVLVCGCWGSHGIAADSSQFASDFHFLDPGGGQRERAQLPSLTDQDTRPESSTTTLGPHLLPLLCSVLRFPYIEKRGDDDPCLTGLELLESRRVGFRAMLSRDHSFSLPAGE